jgi:hypothetical protein
MRDGALLAYCDKPENRFYKLTTTWPRGYPEWRSTIDAIVAEVWDESQRGQVWKDNTFTRCDDPGIHKYVEAVFAVSPPEHIWGLAEAKDVAPERIFDLEKAVDLLSDAVTQDSYGELSAIEEFGSGPPALPREAG